jgi:hypothetical protein
VQPPVINGLINLIVLGYAVLEVIQSLEEKGGGGEHVAHEHIYDTVTVAVVNYADAAPLGAREMCWALMCAIVADVLCEIHVMMLNDQV